MKERRIIVGSVLLILALAGVSSAQAPSFADIEGHWAKEVIEKFAAKGLVRGYREEAPTSAKATAGREEAEEAEEASSSRTVFRPNAHITRAEAVTLSSKAFGSSGRRDVISVLSDVDQGAWYAPFVNEAQGLRIISGFPDGTFRPNDAVTRAAAVKIITLTANIEIETAPLTTLAIFSDVDPHAWYAIYLSALVDRGILRGYGDGTIRPNDAITRAEFLKVLSGLLPGG